MKYIVLVPDGASDYPVRELGGRTPLQAANIPHMDNLAREGLLGTVRTIPPGMSPGSDVANLSIMGYDPTRFYTGRGPLEAASLGVELKADEVAFRCNLVTVAEERLIDYSAGHITSEEAHVLIGALQMEMGGEAWKFYPGVSYRHLLVVSNGAEKARCLPPHDVVGEPVEASLPSGEGAEELVALMKASRNILEGHPVNQKRVQEGKNAANMIWLWGQGKAPVMPTFGEKYGLTGGVITAVDLIKGIGRYAGLRAVDVPGATGYFDTDYAAKAKYALEVLEGTDFVFVHVEAPDEAGHTKNLRAKIEALEKFDEEIVGYVLESLKEQEFKILLLPDHATPLEIATHADDPVPFVIFDSTEKRTFSDHSFNEVAARNSDLQLSQGFLLMDYFITGKLP